MQAHKLGTALSCCCHCASAGRSTAEEPILQAVAGRWLSLSSGSSLTSVVFGAIFCASRLLRLLLMISLRPVPSADALGPGVSALVTGHRNPMRNTLQRPLCGLWGPGQQQGLQPPPASGMSCEAEPSRVEISVLLSWPCGRLATAGPLPRLTAFGGRKSATRCFLEQRNLTESVCSFSARLRALKQTPQVVQA